ncbi:hypothetical protein BC835DRAFT_1419809 [Cytidiella melzeri]|nr:hypothetical protein BC835DRAFT_1419809 [Cytidiella melzeri]
MRDAALNNPSGTLARLTADALPVCEYILSVAAEKLDNEAVLLIQDAGTEHEVNLTTVNWRHLINAVQSRAAELLGLTGLPARVLGDEPFVVGLLGHNSYQYLVTWLALFILRWTPILISPQNSSEAVLHLLKSTHATCLLLDEALEPRYRDLPTRFSKFSILPTFDLAQVQEENPTQIEALLRRVESIKRGEHADALRKEARNICMYMHTSGTTGHPKAIAWSHHWVKSKVTQAAADYPGGKGRVFYTPLPIYHGGGFCMTLPVIAGYGGIITLVEPYQAVSSDSVLRHLRILRDKKPDVLLVPNILEDIVDMLDLSEALEYLRIPNTVLQGGAPLRRDVGDKLAHGGVRIVTWGGITEAGVFASQVFDPTRDPSDWQYVKLTNSFEYHFTLLDSRHPDQGYQLVMSPKIVIPPIINHDNPRGFLTPDIWTKHPDRSNLWRISGRLDDIIVLSNGEKANGKQLDTLLRESPYVSHVVVFGAGRFLCGALLRPSAGHRFPAGDENAKKTYLAKVWSYIDTHVNKTVPRHSRLLQPLVLVEDPSVPFQYSDKGTIKKKATLDLYQEQVEQAYKTVEEGEPPSTNAAQAMNLILSNVAAVTDSVRKLVYECLGQHIDDEADFFNAGLDSLLAVRLRFAIISMLKHAKVCEEVPRNIIYTHPNTATLARYLSSLIDKSDQPEDNKDVAWSSSYRDEVSTATMVNEVVAMLTSSFPARPPTANRDQQGEVYVLTGSTGSLGSVFLSHLLEQPAEQVKKVYALNRASSRGTILQRHQTSFVQKGLDYMGLETAIDNGRAILIETDVTKKRLGIDADLYAEISAQATQIVHNAWPVTFTYHFQSFKPQLDGLRVLIDLALASPRPIPPHLTFISSISVAGRFPPFGNEDVIPELPLSSVAHALPHGYALSKFAAEKILEKATSTTALRASIVRSGQIAGSLTTGAWNRHEYVPGILRASVRAGKVPDDLFTGSPHWLPVEHAAKALYALTRAHLPSAAAPLTFYGFENVRPVHWTTVVSSLLALYPSLHEVPAPEWVHAVRTLQERKEGSSDIIIDGALIDYIEDYVSRKPLPRLATTNLQSISPEVAELVDFDFAKHEEVVEKYIRYAVQE